jgi:hypothetical protein
MMPWIIAIVLGVVGVKWWADKKAAAAGSALGTVAVNQTFHVPGWVPMIIPPATRQYTDYFTKTIAPGAFPNGVTSFTAYNLSTGEITALFVGDTITGSNQENNDIFLGVGYTGSDGNVYPPGTVIWKNINGVASRIFIALPAI